MTVWVPMGRMTADALSKLTVASLLLFALLFVLPVLAHDCQHVFNAASTEGWTTSETQLFRLDNSSVRCFSLAADNSRYSIPGDVDVVVEGSQRDVQLYLDFSYNSVFLQKGATLTLRNLSIIDTLVAVSGQPSSALYLPAIGGEDGSVMSLESVDVFMQCDCLRNYTSVLQTSAALDTQVQFLPYNGQSTTSIYIRSLSRPGYNITDTWFTCTGSTLQLPHSNMTAFITSTNEIVQSLQLKAFSKIPTASLLLSKNVSLNYVPWVEGDFPTFSGSVIFMPANNDKVAVEATPFGSGVDSSALTWLDLSLVPVALQPSTDSSYAQINGVAIVNSCVMLLKTSPTSSSVRAALASGLGPFWRYPDFDTRVTQPVRSSQSVIYVSLDEVMLYHFWATIQCSRWKRLLIEETDIALEIGSSMTLEASSAGPTWIHISRAVFPWAVLQDVVVVSDLHATRQVTVGAPAVECGTGRAVSKNERGSVPLYWATNTSSMTAALIAMASNPQAVPPSVAAVVGQVLPNYPSIIIVAQSMALPFAVATVNSSLIAPFNIQQRLLISGPIMKANASASQDTLQSAYGSHNNVTLDLQGVAGLLNIAPSAGLYLKGITLTNLAAMELGMQIPDSDRSPDDVPTFQRHSLPLFAFTAQRGSQNAPIRLDGCTLLLPSQDYAVLYYAAIKGNEWKVDSASTNLLIQRTKILEASVVRQDYILLKRYVGWGINATYVRVEPAGKVFWVEDAGDILAPGMKGPSTSGAAGGGSGKSVTLIAGLAGGLGGFFMILVVAAMFSLQRLRTRIELKKAQAKPHDPDGVAGAMPLPGTRHASDQDSDTGGSGSVISMIRTDGGPVIINVSSHARYLSDTSNSHAQTVCDVRVPPVWRVLVDTQSMHSTAHSSAASQIHSSSVRAGAPTRQSQHVDSSTDHHDTQSQHTSWNEDACSSSHAGKQIISSVRKFSRSTSTSHDMSSGDGLSSHHAQLNRHSQRASTDVSDFTERQGTAPGLELVEVQLDEVALQTHDRENTHTQTDVSQHVSANGNSRDVQLQQLSRPQFLGVPGMVSRPAAAAAAHSDFNRKDSPVLVFDSSVRASSHDTYLPTPPVVSARKALEDTEWDTSRNRYDLEDGSSQTHSTHQAQDDHGDTLTMEPRSLTPSRPASAATKQQVRSRMLLSKVLSCRDSRSSPGRTGAPEQYKASGDASRSASGNAAVSQELWDPAKVVKDLRDRLGGEAGKLVLLEPIGQGGYGCVYRGKWRGLEVAIKTVLFGLSTHRGHARHMPQQSAVLEAAVCSSVQHQNVVATYHYDIVCVKAAGPHDAEVIGLKGSTIEDSNLNCDYKLYLVQEFCHASLQDALRNRLLHNAQGKPDMDLILTMLMDIARGMQYIHASNIIHGDLTPGNVLLKQDASCPIGVCGKITDFGLCSSLSPDQSHISNITNGTPFYVAPEVVHNGVQSKHADVYSFGVLMWEMYRCMPPWVYTNPGYGPNKLFRTFPDSTPPIYAALCLRCLHLNPKERPGFEEILMMLTAMHAAFMEGYSDLTSPAVLQIQMAGIVKSMIQNGTLPQGIMLPATRATGTEPMFQPHVGQQQLEPSDATSQTQSALNEDVSTNVRGL